MIEAFKVIRFKPATLSLIGHANEIIGEYQALGFTLTLRHCSTSRLAPCARPRQHVDSYKTGAGRHRRPRASQIDSDTLQDRTHNVAPCRPGMNLPRS